MCRVPARYYHGPGHFQGQESSHPESFALLSIMVFLEGVGSAAGRLKGTRWLPLRLDNHF